MDDDIVLSLSGITKRFPGVLALDGVDMDLRRGEVHALCGENGAGKSTLMNVLAGNCHAEAGEIVLRGQRVRIRDQVHSQQLGIAIVYQERSLVDDLSVAENIFAGRQPRSRFGLIDSRALHQRSRRLLDELGLSHINPRTAVGRLPLATRQMVEIAKALSQNPEILLLDEPTATITETEVGMLFKIVRDLTGRGVSVVYISHRMAEVFEIADRVTVLKDGRCQGTRRVKDTGVDDVIRMMVGRDLEERPYRPSFGDEVVLSADDISGEGYEHVSFELKRGEVCSLAGLVGSGRTEVARGIFGAPPVRSGSIAVRGTDRRIRHPRDAIDLGIGYVPEDRKELALFPEMSVGDNIISADLERAAPGRFVNRSRIVACAESFRERLRIATPTVAKKVVDLSGGNQQKVVLAKWLLLDPAILIVDEPTHGIDVGAKAEIHSLIRSLAEKGTSVLVISSELPEVLALSDRILVMCGGRLTATLSRAEATEEEIMHYASGTKTMVA